MLSFSQLFQWNTASEFIADHLNYELLEPAHELVRWHVLEMRSCSNQCSSSSPRHFGRPGRFWLISAETASITPICSVRCWSALDTMRTLSVAMQQERFATWILPVYRIPMQRNAKKYVRSAEYSSGGSDSICLGAFGTSEDANQEVHRQATEGSDIKVWCLHASAALGQDSSRQESTARRREQTHCGELNETDQQRLHPDRWL